MKMIYLQLSTKNDRIEMTNSMTMVIAVDVGEVELLQGADGVAVLSEVRPAQAARGGAGNGACHRLSQHMCGRLAWDGQELADHEVGRRIKEEQKSNSVGELPRSVQEPAGGGARASDARGFHAPLCAPREREA